ncbi:hypothetical protein EHU47_21040 [Escherichia coli]|nr:hypothetical protein [Escherichia coli]
MFAGKKLAQIREILISESTWEEMTCLFAPSLSKLVLNNPLSVLFTSTVRRNNNRAKMNVEFDSWICTRCC